MSKFDLKWQTAREIPHLRRYGHALTGNRDGAAQSPGSLAIGSLSFTYRPYSGTNK